MKLKVNIHRTFDDDHPVKAVASVTMDDVFVVHNVKVIQGATSKFVSMPYESYKNKDGKKTRKDIFHPVNFEARKAMQDAVIAAYNEKVNASANA